MADIEPDKRSQPILLELRDRLSALYRAIENWVRPDPTQAMYLQILTFLVKLPVLILILALSPVLALVLIILFFLAL